MPELFACAALSLIPKYIWILSFNFFIFKHVYISLFSSQDTASVSAWGRLALMINWSCVGRTSSVSIIWASVIAEGDAYWIKDMKRKTDVVSVGYVALECCFC